MVSVVPCGRIGASLRGPSVHPRISAQSAFFLLTSANQNGTHMSELARTVTEPIFINEPRDPNLHALYAYWNTLRGGRPLPRRADIDPTEIPKLLPQILMYDVVAG